MPKGAIYYTGKANNLGMSNCSNNWTRLIYHATKPKVRTKTEHDTSSTGANIPREALQNHWEQTRIFTLNNKARHKNDHFNINKYINLNVIRQFNSLSRCTKYNEPHIDIHIVKWNTIMISNRSSLDNLIGVSHDT